MDPYNPFDAWYPLLAALLLLAVAGWAALLFLVRERERRRRERDQLSIPEPPSHRCAKPRHRPF